MKPHTSRNNDNGTCASNILHANNFKDELSFEVLFFMMYAFVSILLFITSAVSLSLAKNIYYFILILLFSFLLEERLNSCSCT